MINYFFVSGRSTTTNLAVFTRYCTFAFENRLQVDSIYTDFAKAFDRVPHNLLLLKLSKLGVHSNMISWFYHYLSDRYNVVSVDGICSQSFVPTSGIPQGSILGPLLFNIFINDISNCFKNSYYLLYADDLKIFKSISNLNDVLRFQEDLDRVNNWSERNGLEFNLNKCFAMTYHRCVNTINSYYNLNGHILSSVDEILDLGVVFDKKLSFNSHLSYIIPKSYSLLYFIRRNSDCHFDHYTKKILFSSFVRSRLEYCSFIWSPSSQIHSNRIEMVQKRFVKYALSFLNLSTSTSYVDKCTLISLKSLEARRNISSLKFLFNIFNNLIDCPDLLSEIKLHVPSRSLRNISYFFHIDIHRTTYAVNEPLNRCMKLYNSFSNNLDITLSKSEFGNILNNLLN